MDNINSSIKTSANIFLIGFMGSGKTHWGKIWAVNNKRSFIDLDEMIEKTAGEKVAEIFEKKGEDHFRQLETTALKNCAVLTNTIIACGGGTPCYYDNMQWMNEQGTTIYITCTAAEILKRVALEQEKRPLFRKLNKAELLFFIEQKLKEREPFYRMAKITVTSHLLTPTSLPALLSNGSI